MEIDNEDRADYLRRLEAMLIKGEINVDDVPEKDIVALYDVTVG